MSKIALSPNASGTGTFTVTAPNTNTSYTLTLPETTGTLALTTQAITQTTGSPAYYGARAWVNFNGTGTVAIREDVNVSSITDNGTGSYTVNFTTAMPDANYSVNVTVSNDGWVGSTRQNLVSPTVNAVAVASYTGAGSGSDASFVNVVVFR